MSNKPTAIESFLSTKLRLKSNEVCEVFEVEVTDEEADADPEPEVEAV